MVRVARVGKVLYLIHGAQWLAACRLGGRNTISAHVAKMTMAEATAAARSFGAMHSEPLSRADKEAAFRAYVAEGRHLDPMGAPKTCRAIAAELGGLYSHETVRKKLNNLSDADLEAAIEASGKGSERSRQVGKGVAPSGPVGQARRAVHLPPG